MDAIQILAKILVFFLTLWALFTAVTSFLGMSFYFPLRLAEDAPIPEFRWQSVRIAVLLTFSYYGLMHLIRPSRELLPVHFLKVFLFMLTLTGLFFASDHQVHQNEYVYILLFFFSALILHISTKPKLKRYFGKRP